MSPEQLLELPEEKKSGETPALEKPTSQESIVPTPQEIISESPSSSPELVNTKDPIKKDKMIDGMKAGSNVKVFEQDKPIKEGVLEGFVYQAGKPMGVVEGVSEPVKLWKLKSEKEYGKPINLEKLRQRGEARKTETSNDKKGAPKSTIGSSANIKGNIETFKKGLPIEAQKVQKAAEAPRIIKIKELKGVGKIGEKVGDKKIRAFSRDGQYVFFEGSQPGVLASKIREGATKPAEAVVKPVEKPVETKIRKSRAPLSHEEGTEVLEEKDSSFGEKISKKPAPEKPVEKAPEKKEELKPESSFKTAWAILNDKKLGNEAVKAIAGSVASIVGIKSIFDVPQYLQQRLKVRGNILGMNLGKGLEGSAEEILALKAGDKKESYKFRSKEESRSLPIRQALKDLNERLNLTKAGTNRKLLQEEQRAILKENFILNKRIKSSKPEEVADLEKQVKENQAKIEKLKGGIKEINGQQDSIAEILKANRVKETMAKTERHEAFKNLMDKYTETKVTGMQAARESLNSAMVYSGAFGLRAVSYGLMDGVERYKKLKKEKSGGVSILKDVVAGSVKETFDSLNIVKNSEEKGKTRAGLDAIKATSLIARYLGIGVTAASNWGSVSHQAENLLKTLELKTSLGQGVGNFQQGFSNTVSMYSKPFTMAGKMFGEEAHVSGGAEVLHNIPTPTLASTPETSHFTSSGVNHADQIHSAVLHEKIPPVHHDEILPKNMAPHAETPKVDGEKIADLKHKLAEAQAAVEKAKSFSSGRMNMTEQSALSDVRRLQEEIAKAEAPATPYVSPAPTETPHQETFQGKVPLAERYPLKSAPVHENMSEKVFPTQGKKGLAEAFSGDRSHKAEIKLPTETNANTRPFGKGLNNVFESKNGNVDVSVPHESVPEAKKGLVAAFENRQARTQSGSASSEAIPFVGKKGLTEVFPGSVDTASHVSAAEVAHTGKLTQSEVSEMLKNPKVPHEAYIPDTNSTEYKVHQAITELQNKQGKVSQVDLENINKQFHKPTFFDRLFGRTAKVINSDMQKKILEAQQLHGKLTQEDILNIFNKK